MPLCDDDADCAEVLSRFFHEMGAEPTTQPKLSVTASSLPLLKRMVRKVSIQQCERVAKKAGSLDSDAAVAAFVRDQARKIIPEVFDGRSAEH